MKDFLKRSGPSGQLVDSKRLDVEDRAAVETTVGSDHPQQRSSDAPSHGRPHDLTYAYVCFRPTEADAGRFSLLDESGKEVATFDVACCSSEEGAFDVSPDGKWIVYGGSEWQPKPLIALETATGKTNLAFRSTAASANVWNPRFSPSGDRLACNLSYNQGSSPEIALLAVYTVGSLTTGLDDMISNPLRIGNHAPQFAPDGQALAYLGNYAYEDMLEVCLHRFAKGESPRRDVRLTQGASCVWRRPRAITVQPQGGRIYFIRGHSMDHQEVAFISPGSIPATGYAVEFATVSERHGNIRSIAVSHDGLRVAYDADGGIYVVNADGTDLARVASGSNPRFSPNSETLSYMDEKVLHLMNLSNRSVTVAEVEQISDYVAGDWSASS
jgi:hypothetical protein